MSESFAATLVVLAALLRRVLRFGVVRLAHFDRARALEHMAVALISGTHHKVFFRFTEMLKKSWCWWVALLDIYLLELQSFPSTNVKLSVQSCWPAPAAPVHSFRMRMPAAPSAASICRPGPPAARGRPRRLPSLEVRVLCPRRQALAPSLPPSCRPPTR
jgi:hypothetical protein